MKQIRKIIAMLLAIAMLMGLAACGAAEEEAASTAASVPAAAETEAAEEPEAPVEEGFTPALDTTAEISLNVVGDYGNFEALEQVILDFQAYYPNVTITYEQIPDFGSGFPLRCASGENLDLFFMNSADCEHAYGDSLSEYALDLSTIDGIDFSAVNENALTGGQIDGKQLLLPVFYQTGGLICNTTLLDSYGIAVPTSMSELAAACDALLEKGVTPLYGADTIRGRIFVGMVVSDILAADNSAELISEMESGTADASIFDSAVALYQEWADKGYFNDEANTLDDNYNAAILRFFEGDVPFLIGSSDTISGCRKREEKSEAFTANPFDYTYVMPSMNDSATNILFSTAQYFGIYNKSEHADYAQEFLRFMATRDELITLATVKGIPSTTEQTGDSRFTYVESLASSDKLYSTTIGLSAHALSCLNSAVYAIPEDPSSEAAAAVYAEKMAG